MKKYFFLFVALFVCCTLASVQSELGLPPNEEQPEPTIFHPELPYSYSSILVTPMGNAVSCYDAKSGAEYKKYEGESKYSITLKENVDGKSVATVYDIFPDSKSYQILMQLPKKILMLSRVITQVKIRIMHKVSLQKTVSRKKILLKHLIMQNLLIILLPKMAKRVMVHQKMVMQQVKVFLPIHQMKNLRKQYL